LMGHLNKAKQQMQDSKEMELRMKREETESKILEKIEEENKALSEKKKTELEQQRIEEQELIASLDERLESKQRELAAANAEMYGDLLSRVSVTKTWPPLAWCPVSSSNFTPCPSEETSTRYTEIGRKILSLKSATSQSESSQ